MAGSGGGSSVGRTPDLHSGGRGFDSLPLHQYKRYNSVMNKKLIKQLGNPLGWLYVILVVCLLYIISNNSKRIADLEAQVSFSQEETEQVRRLGQAQVDAMQDEIAVRDDALMGANSEITMLDDMLGRMKAQSNEAEKNLDEVFEILANTKQELNDTKTLLDVCMAQTPTE